MDKDHVKTFQELNNMQSKISSLFKDLLVERYHYKIISDKLKKNLEEVSIEVRNLKIENEKLQQKYQELKNLIQECVKIFKCLGLSENNLIKDHKIVMDTIKTILAQENNVHPESLEICVAVKKELSLDRNDHSIPRYKISQDDIKKEIDAIKDLQFTTQFFDTVEMNKETVHPDENLSEIILENLCEGKYSEGIENFKRPLIVQETEFSDEKNPFVGFGIQEPLDSLEGVICY